jgi:hypothetical protein
MHSTLPSTVPTVVEGRPAAPGVFVSPDSSTDGPVKGPANQTSTLQAATSSTVVPPQNPTRRPLRSHTRLQVSLCVLPSFLGVFTQAAGRSAPK